MDLESRQIITYKHFDFNTIKGLEADLELFSSFKSILKTLNYNLNDRNKFTTHFFKNEHLFLIFVNHNLAGLNIGKVVEKKYFSNITFVLPKYQNEKIGLKLKLRLISFLRSKHNVNYFDGYSIVNNKVYGINEFISKRINKTKKGTYNIAPKNPEKPDFYTSKDGSKKVVNVLKFKRK